MVMEHKGLHWCYIFLFGHDSGGAVITIHDSNVPWQVLFILNSFILKGV